MSLVVTQGPAGPYQRGRGHFKDEEERPSSSPAV